MELDDSFYERFAELCREAAQGLRELELHGAAVDAAMAERLFRVSHDLAGQAGLLELRRVYEVAAFAADQLRGRATRPAISSAAAIACVARLLEAAAADASGADTTTELDTIVRELSSLS